MEGLMMTDDPRAIPSDPVDAPRPGSLVASVDATLAALDLRPEDQALAALARLTARAIDEMAPELRGRMIGQATPALQRVLVELGQRRSTAGSWDDEEGSTLAAMRARVCLRKRLREPARMPNGAACWCATCRLRALVGPEFEVDEDRVLPGLLPVDGVTAR